MIVRSFKDIEGTDRTSRPSPAPGRASASSSPRSGSASPCTRPSCTPGTETSMWYANHIEAVLCVEGEAELTNDETGEKHRITPGTMYLLDGHERHTMRAQDRLPLRLRLQPARHRPGGPRRERRLPAAHRDRRARRTTRRHVRQRGTGPSTRDERSDAMTRPPPDTHHRPVPDPRHRPRSSLPARTRSSGPSPARPGPIAADRAARLRAGRLPHRRGAAHARRGGVLPRGAGPARPPTRRSAPTSAPSSSRSRRTIRSVFEVHRISEVFAELVRDPRVVGRARQILGSDVYVHQRRINVKPGFGATGFYWHSDFETWHAEDGLPNMRTVSVSIALTENYDTNGGLMIMPGSHQTFLGCAGATPKDNYKQSLQMQDAGTPSDEALTELAGRARHQAVHRRGRLGDLVRLQLHARLAATTSRRSRAATSSSSSTAWRTRRWSRSRRRSAGRSSSGHGTSRRCGSHGDTAARPPHSRVWCGGRAVCAVRAGRSSALQRRVVDVAAVVAAVEGGAVGVVVGAAGRETAGQVGVGQEQRAEGEHIGVAVLDRGSSWPVGRGG